MLGNLQIHLNAISDNPPVGGAIGSASRSNSRFGGSIPSSSTSRVTPVATKSSRATGGKEKNQEKPLSIGGDEPVQKYCPNSLPQPVLQLLHASKHDATTTTSTTNAATSVLNISIAKA